MIDDGGGSPRGGKGHRVRRPLVVGVGGSAGAMESIERLFAKIVLADDQAIVLVLQHSEAFDESELRRIRDGHQMLAARDGTEIEGGTIYLCAADMITTIHGERFVVRRAEPVPSGRATIDSFLVSLAEERAEASIGVVLAGTGEDGTLGVATLKDHGGLAIAERVAGENSNHLPNGNTPAAIADFLLAPEDIPQHIQLYARYLRRLELQSVNEELTAANGKLAHRVQELTRTISDLKNFLESTQIASVFLDNGLRVMNFTPAITQVLHLAETDVGRPISHIKARIPIEELYGDVRRVLRTLASAERELTAPDTGTRYIVRILPYRSIDNFIAGVVITFIDVTAVTRAEERQRLLLAELQHRVRNMLGVVRSIARRTAENSTTVEDYAAHLDGRLNAFARTQALATRDPEGGVDLEYLVLEELHAYNAKEGEVVRVSGPPVRLQPKAAETFALAIHELATNAVKYGALSLPSGRIEITWRIENAADQAQLVFDWLEKGGPAVAPPQRKGFGTELLERTLAFEMKGQTALSFNASGLHCRINIPLNRRTVHTPAVGD